MKTLFGKLFNKKTTVVPAEVTLSILDNMTLGQLDNTPFSQEEEIGSGVIIVKNKQMQNYLISRGFGYYGTETIKYFYDTPKLQVALVEFRVTER